MTHAIATTSLSFSRMDSTTPATMSKNHDANEYVSRAAKYLHRNLIGFNGIEEGLIFHRHRCLATTANRPMIGVCGQAAKVNMLHERAPGRHPRASRDHGSQIEAT
jgi:hypothetical protein